jgi:hypothetical protein
MREDYAEWIRANAPATPDEARGECGPATARMLLAFPELERICGFYRDPVLGHDYQHFWLEAPDGSVVDPTGIQFPAFTSGEGSYHRFESAPLARCMHCGAPIFDGSRDGAFCRSSCAKQFAATCGVGV